ncbi:transforming growth factor beta-2 proprotein-like [Patiria miniata]|uniref:TGF-beta family profile domain-containing protein n=1 Tax=Patiria miniata TaxID=46514 RepID=A0A914BAX3_PATMI|nr:transforming growth factor beta-2 proprotein-like [Patiria miniata]
MVVIGTGCTIWLPTTRRRAVRDIIVRRPLTCRWQKMGTLVPPRMTSLHLTVMCLALWALLQAATGGSGQCKLNFQEYQNRRRSAIQAQILSKLGLTAPPTDIGPEEVPEDVIAMYNETVRILEERREMMESVCQQAQSEEYFAKVPKVYPLDKKVNPDIDNYQTMKLKQSKFFRFDLSSYTADVNSDEVFEAELRLYQLPNAMKEEEQHIDVYQLIPSPSNGNPGRKHVFSTVLDTTTEGWIKIDVTQAVREWVSIPGSNLGIEVTTPCDDTIHVLFAHPKGTMPSVKMPTRGDQQMADMSPREQHPRLIVLAPANDTIGSNSGTGHRSRRSTSTYGQNTCSDQTQPSCCLRQFYVNFKRHLGWGWIRQPKGYYPNYCAGSCSYVNGSVWNAQTHHGSVLDTYRRLNPDASPSPCCSPRSFKPLHILFYDKGRPLFRELPNAIVTSCQCS